ncbi:hypothetical protein [Pelosinus propionicus]|nr:hypothetical protein [Pelosinus propionicus]
MMSIQNLERADLMIEQDDSGKYRAAEYEDFRINRKVLDEKWRKMYKG